MATERDRAKDYKEAYDQAAAGFGSWQMQCKKDLQCYLGDTWTAKDRQRFAKEKREAMSFPEIRRFVKWITGYERDNILSIRYDPTENGDLTTAEQFTAINTWSMGRNDGYYVISDAFEGCLKTAMNLVNVYNDRNYNTFLERFSYNQFMLDPTFSQRNLRDCSYGMMRKYITKEDAKMLLPDKEAFIERIVQTMTGGQNEMYPYYSRPQLYGDNLLSYDEFQQRTTKVTRYILIKPLSLEIEWLGGRNSLYYFMDKLVEMYGIPAHLLSVITRREQTIEVTAFLEGKEVSHGIDVFGIGDFSFTPIICYYDPEYDVMEMKMQSIVRGLVDQQRANDRRMMSMVAMFEQQIGAGLDFEEDTLVDEEDAFLTGSGRPRLFKKDALMQQRARDRQIPDIPTGMFQLEDLTSRKMAKTIGINEEMTGFASSAKGVGGQQGNPQVAGFVSKLRMAAGLVGLKDLFDNLALSKKTIGAKLLRLYQQYPFEKVRRILNQEPTQEFFNKQFGEYDAAVTQGLITDNQKNLFYADLVQMTAMLMKLNQPVPPFVMSMLLKSAPIAAKPEFLKEVQKYEQQQQATMQREKQKQEVMQQLEMERAKGEIVANRGIAEAQRAKAVEDISDAAYNRARTAAEIQDLVQNRVIQLLQAAIDLEKINQQNTEVKAKS